nr:TMEM175 family protein [Microbulbifer sediminum]
METFSDGVIAIIITIMVLNMDVPHGHTIDALVSVIPVFLTYVLSFVYLGIYWSNHHHLLQAADSVNRPILWANLYLLFWLSLIPFATGWMGENSFARGPAALYGAVLLMSAIAYWILRRLIVASLAPEARHNVVRQKWKGRFTLLLYGLAIPLAFIWEWLALSLYVLTALLWLVPDRHLDSVNSNTGG